MPDMIDIHNHGLFGVDDGAKTMAESCQMLTLAYNQGVRVVCFTPHYHPVSFRCSSAEIEKRFAALSAWCADHLPGMQLYLGNEIFHHHEAVAEFGHGKGRPLGKGQAVLVEFSPTVAPLEMRNAFLDWISAGYIPILAHAERYSCLLRDVRLAEELVYMQVALQIDADTVLAWWHMTPYRFAHRLLRAGLVSVVASDAHSAVKKSPNMAKAYRKIAKKYGTYYAKCLFWDNPKQYVSPTKKG